MAELSDVIKGLEYLHDKETWREGIMIYDDHARVRKQITKDALDLIDAQVRHMATLVSNQIMAEDTPMIVRCKDCRHRDPEDHKCDCGHDIQWQLPRQDNWYCADGEAKVDG